MPSFNQSLLTDLIQGNPIEQELIDWVYRSPWTAEEFLYSQAFFSWVKEFLAGQEGLSLVDAVYSLRSILLPLLQCLQVDPPSGDIYHALTSGYAGLLGLMARRIKQKPLCLTEHGLYLREREEEILQANWIKTPFKPLWINMFHSLTKSVYLGADKVTALFEGAKSYQLRRGASKEKCLVIPNGVRLEGWSSIPLKQEGGFHFGAVLRLDPIKDVHSLLKAWALVEKSLPQVRLSIIGGSHDEAYAQSCFELARNLELKRADFLGPCKVNEEMGGLDCLILTSISEGQPLALLEAMAASRPCIATDVGACRELLLGSNAEDKAAGLVVQAMDIVGMAEAMIFLAKNRKEAIRMGAVARKRVEETYQHDKMLEGYRCLYEEVRAQWPQQDQN